MSITDFKSVGPIGVWLKDNTNDYFARPVKVGTSIRGFEYSFEMPFCGFITDLNSKFQNLPSHRIDIIVVISKKELVIFYCNLNYIEIGWDSKTLSNPIKWYFSICLITSIKDIEEKVNLCLENAVDSIITSIGNKINPDTSTEVKEPIDDLPF
jgi:hypothetical protein